MRSRVVPWLAAALIALAGCDNTGPEPLPELIGVWGGTLAELTVTPDTAILQLPCSRGGFATVPVLEGGRFEAPVRLRSTNYDQTVLARGTMTPWFLHLTLVFPNAEEDFSLMRGERGEFDGIACAW